MQVFESRITHWTYDADFDRVEAAVALLVKTGAGQPVKRVSLRTSQPRHGDSPIEDRLTRDAIRLARSMAKDTAPPAEQPPAAA